MTYVYLNQDVVPPEAHAFEADGIMDGLQQAADLWFGGQVVAAIRQTGQTISLLDRIATLDARNNAPRCIGTVRRMS
jgi:hypothetical protein